MGSREYRILAADFLMKRALSEAEENRRERPGFDTSSPTPGVMDYAHSGSVMELAMAHMRESIPNGQVERTAAAFFAMEEAMVQTRHWLEFKGII